MPEKFLILGANSFYGSNFARLVEQKGYPVLRSRHYEPPQESFDYVVNFASMSLVAESWERPWAWMDANTVHFSFLLHHLKDKQIKKFVHVSTPESYGHTDGWVDETYADWHPSTPYAVSRAAADMMLMAYYRAHGLPGVITRTANIYGRGQGAGRFIPLAFKTFRAGQKLDLHGHGHTRRSFIHVSDACTALYLVAKRGSVGQTYHISTTRDVSINELAQKICGLVGKRPQDLIGSQPDRLGKDQAYLLASERIRRMGWRDTITLEKGLEDYARA